MLNITPFKILCGIGLLAIFSSTISKNPSLPLLITHLGGNQMEIGFIAGISSFTGILFSFPADFLENSVGDGLFSMLLMLVVGVPLYVCATASTPVAAALALKGLSPGAALVFLLAGPATYTATIAVAAKILGKKAAVIYVVAIAICSIAAGIAVNFIYESFGFTVMDWVAGSTHEHENIFFTISAAALLIATVWAVISPLIFPHLTGGRKSSANGPCCGS